MIPQLRCRTEFTFRDGGRDIATFAPVGRMGARLAEIEAPAAGIVDGGTWGHVRWAKEMSKRGVAPLFGTELTVVQPDGRKPKAWALAADTKDFYRFSTAARRDDADVEALFASSPGIVRFAGGALTNPDTFDYIDVNPGSPFSQLAAKRLHQLTGRPLVLTGDNLYASPGDYAAFMAISGRSKVTPAHVLDVEELRRAIPVLDDDQFHLAMLNTCEAAERCATELPVAPMISFPGDLDKAAYDGAMMRVSKGHIAAWTAEYDARLRRELLAIAEKGFESYFFVVADLIAWSKQRMLVGPGRGSSAGSLVCYCLGITEVDPLPHGLLFERFIDLTRKDLPDIDIDFSDTKRHLCFEYLAEKYGAENVARIGNVNTMKPKTVMGKIGEVFGIPQPEVFGLLNVLIEYSSGDTRYGHSLEDTLKLTDTGRAFVARHPEAALMGEIENHATHTGVHAAGVIVSNVRVDEYCTVGKEGVAQIDKPDSEFLNLLKIDALGLSTLGVIEDAGVITGEQLYALKLDDPKVFEVMNAGKFGGVFQFEGQAQRSVAGQITIRSFQEIDHITALARPGPLGGGATTKYCDRHEGRAPIVTTHPRMAEMLADTYGVVLYQEQVMRIVREIGKFSWEQTTVIRKAMSGRKGKEFFDKQGEAFVTGAAEDGIDKETAQKIWDEICNFGAWGMNKSHTCAYAVIAYWCAWMKAHHPLEYAAACLREAGTKADGEVKTLEILRELANEGTHYIPFDPALSDIDWAARDGHLVGGFRNLVGFGPAKSAAAVAARAAGAMSEKMLARIEAAPRKYTEMYPLRAEYAAAFRDPTSIGCAEGSVILSAPELMSGEYDGRMVLFLAKVIKKTQRDENEALLIGRRGGEVKEGKTLFADFQLRDDYGVPVICRIPPYRRRNRTTREFESAEYEPLGRVALDRLAAGKDVVLVRGKKVPNYPMLQVLRMKCLTNPEALDDAKG